MDLYTATLTQQDAEQMRGHLERAQREEREWAEAQLHRALHGNWMGSDDCPICIADASLAEARS